MYKIATVFGKSFIVRTSDGAFIPEDEGNVDYREYLAWVAEGNVAGSWP